jgi:hypothetical protein
LLIGRDRAKRWVVRDVQGRRGGWFVDRAAALKYALFENGNRPQAVVMVAGRSRTEHGRGAASGAPACGVGTQPIGDAVAPYAVAFLTRAAQIAARRADYPLIFYPNRGEAGAGDRCGGGADIWLSR